jgi:Tfp pilus assembly protein PilN
MSAIGLRAFNLLPYRPGARRRARNRALALLAGASVAGCGAVGAMAGWDALTRAHLDEQRVVLDQALARLSAPLAEHARLAELETSRRRAENLAVPIAEPRARFLGLLDGLAQGASQGNVGLQRVTQRASEVELAASAPDSQAAAAWLKALENVPGVRAVEIVEMRRRAALPVRNARADQSGGYDFVAVVRWADGVGSAKTAKLLKASKRGPLSSVAESDARSGTR